MRRKKMMKALRKKRKAELKSSPNYLRPGPKTKGGRT